MDKRIKIFYLSWTVPPSQGGSAYITHQLLKNFSKEEVIAAGGSKHIILKPQLYDGVQYHYIFSEINWRGHGARFFFALRWLIFPLVLFRLSKLVRNNKPDLLFVTFPDGYYLFAGYLLSLFFDLPLFTYFHNTYAENRKGLFAWISRWLQTKVFNRSLKIFTMSEGMMAYYSKEYPKLIKKFEVLQHTFNEIPGQKESVIEEDTKQKIRLVFIGTINQSNLDASRRVFEAVSKMSEFCQLDIYSPSQKQLLKIKYGLDLEISGIHHCGVVNQEEVHKILQPYDLCLLAHGFTGGYDEIEYRTIFPTRCIPLLLSGKPILAHTPSYAFLTHFLKQWDCAEIVEEASVEKLCQTLQFLIHDKNRRKELIANQANAVKYFYGPDVFLQWKSILVESFKS
ncbi:MAG: glycosyltransferase [Saprospiraceae bacterium]|nr:glycosyltransferase [Saprospiraceae bacterium]